MLLEALFEKARPVFEGAHHHPGVDEVEVLTVGPLGFGIVDFEGAVLGDAGGYLLLAGHIWV